MAALVMFVLAGCAEPVAGNGSPDPAWPPPLTAAQAIGGDFATIEYCSLADEEPLATFAQPITALDAMKGCGIGFVEGSPPIGLYIGRLYDFRKPQQYRREQVPRAGLPFGVRQEGQQRPGLCRRFVVFADEIALESRASERTGEGAPPNPAELCAAADAGVTSMVKNINERSVRHWQFGERSWAPLQACGFAPDDVVTQRAGLPHGTKGTLDPSRHACEWGDPESGALVTFDFSFGATYGAPLETIAGRGATVSVAPNQYRSVCTVVIYHIRAPTKKELSETAEVIVAFSEPGRGVEACAAARDIAAAAFPLLPPT